VDRLAGVVRGIFAPALTAGAALALVGAVGTFAPSVLPSAQSGGAPAASELEGAVMNGDAGAAPGAAKASDSAEEDARTMAEASAEDGAESDSFTAVGGSAEATPVLLEGSSASPTDESEGAEPMPEPALPADRPIWPMLLFSGVALIVLMFLLRWILAPRAG